MSPSGICLKHPTALTFPHYLPSRVVVVLALGHTPTHPLSSTCNLSFVPQNRDSDSYLKNLQAEDCASSSKGRGNPSAPSHCRCAAAASQAAPRRLGASGLLQLCVGRGDGPWHAHQVAGPPPDRATESPPSRRAVWEAGRPGGGGSVRLSVSPWPWLSAEGTCLQTAAHAAPPGHTRALGAQV